MMVWMKLSYHDLGSLSMLIGQVNTAIEKLSLRRSEGASLSSARDAISNLAEGDCADIRHP